MYEVGTDRSDTFYRLGKNNEHDIRAVAGTISSSTYNIQFVLAEACQAAREGTHTRDLADGATAGSYVPASCDGVFYDIPSEETTIASQ